MDGTGLDKCRTVGEALTRLDKWAKNIEVCTAWSPAAMDQHALAMRVATPRSVEQPVAPLILHARRRDIAALATIAADPVTSKPTMVLGQRNALVMNAMHAARGAGLDRDYIARAGLEAVASRNWADSTGMLEADTGHTPEQDGQADALQLSAVALRCGKLADDPYLRMREIVVDDLLKITAAQALAILGGYVRAMTPKDEAGKPQPSWPRRVGLRGACFYGPECTENHHFLTCPKLRAAYRQGEVKLVRIPRRDGSEFSFNIYDHPSYLKLVADNLNGGVLVPQNTV
jgi:hypothetical protein